MSQILLVSGTRPEVIKLAPLFHYLRKTARVPVQWLHTGQHDVMAEQAFACFDVVPDLKLSRRGASLSQFSAGCREDLDAVLAQGDWSLVVVQGDTESAFQGALAAFHNRIPVAHVEAGLRTSDLERPFPEEGLRQMIARLARFHFAPTARAQDALLREGILPASVFVTGNTVVDAQEWIRRHRRIRRRVAGRGHLLVTVHRRENWGDDVEEICLAVRDIAESHPELDVLFPVHVNPVVREPIHAALGGVSSVRLVAPLDYVAMQQALADAWLVLTDSGGLQEEAPTYRVPLVVLRQETERPEVVEAGCAILTGARRSRIVRAVERLWHDEDAYRQRQAHGNPFGDGAACERIAAVLQAHLSAGVESAA